MEGAIQSAELQTLEFHPVEFYDMSMSDHVYMMNMFWKDREGICWHFMHDNMVMLLRMPKLLWLQCARKATQRFQVRPHPLPVCSLTMAQEHRQEQVRDAIKKATPKPAPSKPLDPERTMGHDPRDPRADSQQWPCMGAHTHGRNARSLGALPSVQPSSPVCA